MARGKPLGYVCYILYPDGSTVLFDELTEEEKAAWQKRVCQRLSERMSEYYSQHPEEYMRLSH